MLVNGFLQLNFEAISSTDWAEIVYTPLVCKTVISDVTLNSKWRNYQDGGPASFCENLHYNQLAGHTGGYVPILSNEMTS